MSNDYSNVVAALNADHELQAKVLAATTPEERAALLSAAGFELPTPEEIEAAKLAGVDGGSTPLTTVPVQGLPGRDLIEASQPECGVIARHASTSNPKSSTVPMPGSGRWTVPTLALPAMSISAIGFP